MMPTATSKHHHENIGKSTALCQIPTRSSSNKLITLDSEDDDDALPVEKERPLKPARPQPGILEDIPPTWVPWPVGQQVAVRVSVVHGGTACTVTIETGTERLAPIEMYSSSSSSSTTLRLVPEMYLSEILRVSFREDKFIKAMNPAKRPRQFDHLQGRDLYDALVQLPNWEQLHELTHIFLDIDVLLAYNFDEEPYAKRWLQPDFATAHGLLSPKSTNRMTD